MNVTGENLGIVLGVLTLVSTLWFSARKVGALETTIAALVASVAELSADLKKQAAELQLSNQAMNSLRVTVVGTPDAPNGIRSQVIDLTKQVDRLREWRHDENNKQMREQE